MIISHEGSRAVSLLALVALACIPTAGCASRELPTFPLLPRVDEVSPRGVRRGYPIELTIRGSSLSGNPRLVAPFKFAVDAARPGDSEANSLRVRITVDPASPLGVYPVRVLTDQGLSDPFPLAVEQLPQIAEKEDNGNIDWHLKESQWTAQRITLPTVIEGELPTRRDIDFFRLSGESHQRIFAGVQSASIGSGSDLGLDLLSLDRYYATHVETWGDERGNPPLFATLPYRGDYLFGVLNAQHRGTRYPRRFYRLTIGALPAAAEVYPLGGRRAETIRVELQGGTLDGVMVVPVTLTPELGEPATVPYKVEVDANEFMHFPAYLRANYPVQPGLFATAVKAYPLHLDAPAGPIDVRRGSRTTFKVRVNRSEEAAGALTLGPLRLPAGLSIPNVELGPEATEAAVAVHVSDAHPTGMVTIVLTARGKIAGADWGFTVPAVTLRVLPPVAINLPVERAFPTP
jgi:hypothetical protein